MSALINTVGLARKILLSYLRSAAPPAKSIYATVSRTYGAFIDGKSIEADQSIEQVLRSQKIPSRIGLRGTPRVLLCLDALRLRNDQGAISMDVGSTMRLRRCVLVHEHFHAAMNLAPFPGGGVPLVPPGDLSALVYALHEALAVWFELHFAREDDCLRSTVLEFIANGEWPDWPYRGAEHLEKFFAKAGIDYIHKLVSRFRRDPAAMAIEFNVLTTGEFPGQM